MPREFDSSNGPISVIARELAPEQSIFEDPLRQIERSLGFSPHSGFFVPTDAKRIDIKEIARIDRAIRDRRFSPDQQARLEELHRQIDWGHNRAAFVLDQYGFRMNGIRKSHWSTAQAVWRKPSV